MAKSPKTNTVTLLTSTKAITAATNTLAAAANMLQHDAHTLACSVLAHVGKHGQIGIVNNFLAAMPDMTRKNSLILWFETFGKLKYEGKAMCYVSTKPQRLGDAMEKPFWKFKANEGVPYQPLIMDTYIDQQIKKLEKDQKETKQDHSALIGALKAHKATILTALPN